MKLVLRFVGWSLLLFIPTWWISQPYQHGLAGLAGHIAAPRGMEIQWVDVQLYYPMDLGIYAALCLASAPASWRRRFVAIAVGVPLLVATEIVSVVAGMRILMASSSARGASPEAQRLATAIIRVAGLTPAILVWLYFLGREWFARELNTVSRLRKARRP